MDRRWGMAGVFGRTAREAELRDYYARRPSAMGKRVVPYSGLPSWRTRIPSGENRFFGCTRQRDVAWGRRTATSDRLRQSRRRRRWPEASLGSSRAERSRFVAGPRRRAVRASARFAATQRRRSPLAARVGGTRSSRAVWLAANPACLFYEGSRRTAVRTRFMIAGKPERWYGSATFTISGRSECAARARIQGTTRAPPSVYFVIHSTRAASCRAGGSTREPVPFARIEHELAPSCRDP